MQLHIWECSRRWQISASTERVVGSASESELGWLTSLFGQWPFRGVALVLFASAASKIWLLATDPFAGTRMSLPLEVIWATAAFEILLGVTGVIALAPIPPSDWPGQ
jgi:hypothetical protein